MSMLRLENITKIIHNGSNEEKILLDHIDFQVNAGDFVTVLGGNGAGKSTLFNTISGSLPATSGKIFIDNQEVTHLSEELRAPFIARVFQDPKMGTAPRMTVAENLLLAKFRGQKRSLKLRKLNQYQEEFYQLCAQIGNGLEAHLQSATGDLSGGQRQALSLLMATIQSPKLLLLDEHTAALDPKTAKQLMHLTAEIVEQKQLTCMMITHRMEDALKYGNRLIVLKKGKVIKDLSNEEKAALTMNEVLHFFEDDFV